MNTKTTNVQIVEFSPQYAAGVAKMWNESRDSWGGDDSVMTADQVLEKESNSTNLFLYLALVDGEVAGYCSLSEYREDSNALYIPLLNVHPDYHGHKLGKQLVLNAVNKTVELGWPRLDLFTWAGNTKAVPLYKKCGFFWEDRDDSVHLMNFIPTILQLECLKPFFDQYSWYDTSKRTLEVKPDGYKHNGYTFYEYEWSADDAFVKVRFERTSRKLCYVETNDFKVEMAHPTFKTLANKESQMEYRVENKRQTPLSVNIQANQEGAIQHQAAITDLVEKEAVYTAPVIVQYNEQEPNDWKTHPTMEATVTINGYDIPLGLGVYPILPVSIKLASTNQLFEVNKNPKLFLEVESLVEEEGTLKVSIPSNDILTLHDPSMEVSLNQKQRTSIPLSASLQNGGAFDEEITCAFSVNGEEITFQTRLRFAFPTKTDSFAAETSDKWLIFNGRYYASLEKRNNTLSLGRRGKGDHPLPFFAPKLGKPYADEWTKKEAGQIKVEKTDAGITFVSVLSSDLKPGLHIESKVTLSNFGLYDMSYKLVLDGNQEAQNVSWVQGFVPLVAFTYIPMGEEVLRLKESHVAFNDYLDKRHYSEPWTFTDMDGETIGFAWSDNVVHRRDEWKNAVELTDIDVPKSVQTSIPLATVSLAYNHFSSWEEWREEVMGEQEPLREVGPLTLEQTNGDIILQDNKPSVSLHSRLHVPVVGELVAGNEVTTIQNSEEDLTVSVEVEMEPITLVHTSFTSPNTKVEETLLYLQPNTSTVSVEEVEAGHWKVTNGDLQFKVHKEYMAGVYSVMYKGEEWLHHTYPTPSMKAWWNPWTGGLRYRFGGMNSFSLQKEVSDVKAVSKYDSKGNEWTGVEVTTTIVHHEKFKGTTLKQYFLTLPGLPMITTLADWTASVDKLYAGERIFCDGFWNPGDELATVTYDSEVRGQKEYYAGAGELILIDDPYARLRSTKIDDALHIVQPKYVFEKEAYVTKEVCYVNTETEWTLPAGETTHVQPTIHLFDNRDLRPYLEQLRGITFK